MNCEQCVYIVRLRMWDETGPYMPTCRLNHPMDANNCKDFIDAEEYRRTHQ